MPDHNDAPEEHQPEGAAVEPAETEAPDDATMIGKPLPVGAHDPAAVDDATKVGEPLPVGAHDPARVVEAEAETDEGQITADVIAAWMPHEPDDLDREMATLARSITTNAFWERRSDLGHNSLSEATVQQALMGAIYGVPREGEEKPVLGLLTNTPREALLAQVAIAAWRQRRAAEKHAEAVRALQESRDEYRALAETIYHAIDAIYALGLDVKDDHDVVEPTPEPDRIPDSAIR